MSGSKRIWIGIILIILLCGASLFLMSDGKMNGEAILFVVFVIVLPLVLGCSAGAFIIKIMEKNTGEKPAYNTILFYIGIPCCMFMFIAITLFRALVNR